MEFILKHYGKVLNKVVLEEGKEYILGRHKDCDFVLKDEAGLSRKHIKIYQNQETGFWVVESLSEFGGLYLNAEAVERVEIEQSLVLSLKNHSLEFIKEEQITEENESPNEQILSSAEEQQEKSLSGKTKIFSTSKLIYSLYVYIKGEFSDHIILSDEGSWTIGRSEECDISIDYSILTRKHIKITKKPEGFLVEDLGSSNKTFLNDQELKARQPVRLKANDQISISDLKIRFEVRDETLKNQLANIPTSLTEGDLAKETLAPSIAFSKVVLEEASEDEFEISQNRFINKKWIWIFGGLLLTGVLSYAYYDSKKNQEQKISEQDQKLTQINNQKEGLYIDALNHLQNKRYTSCIDQIKELYKLSPEGHKDSQNLLVQCQNALEVQKQQEEMAEREKLKQETERKIQEIVNKCQSDYKAKIIKTETDLILCAKPLETLDPNNPEISKIRMDIKQKQTLLLLERQKKENHQKWIQGKKNLYNKAKKIADSKKPLKAVEAYNVFLKSSKNISELKNLYNQSLSERDQIQKEYDEKLNSLYKLCKNFIEEKSFKNAYYYCKNVLDFQPDHKQALTYMNLAEESLKISLKPLYEQSMLDESFAKIKQAKELWNEILDKDISEGYYYKKALNQIKKYK